MLFDMSNLVEEECGESRCGHMAGLGMRTLSIRYGHVLAVTCGLHDYIVLYMYWDGMTYASFSN